MIKQQSPAMTRSATLKTLKAESKDAAVILADGTITEHHPGTDFTPLNNNGEASDGTINDENGEHGTEADEENAAVCLKAVCLRRP